MITLILLKLNQERHHVLLTLLSIFNISLVSIWIIYAITCFFLTDKYGAILRALDECNISVEEAAEELRSAQFIEPNFGYTSRLMVLRRSIIIPFQAAQSAIFWHKVISSYLVINCKNDTFKIYEFINQKKRQNFETLLRINKSKLLPDFKIEDRQEDYSD